MTDGLIPPRPRIVGKQVEEAARLTGRELQDEVSVDDLIRFLHIFDLIQQRDVTIGYDDKPFPPWSIRVKEEQAERLSALLGPDAA